MSFNHLEIEKKWQKYWEENKTFKTLESDSKEKKYILDMFPYPSGSGLHVGHPEGYTVTDILSRYYRMKGFNVMHPMGWDAFGLPAEQFAFQTGRDPKEFTYENIETFKRQIKSLGFSYDWDRELATCDPSFYKNTQWIFSKLYEHGLAELKEVEVNWCEELGTVLANDEIINDNGKMVSERGGFLVIKKPMKQWILKITNYAERLLDDLDDLSWSHALKEMQRNWIGKSVGALVKFKVLEYAFEVFTTRPDTLYGATYVVLAPEHELVLKITSSDQLDVVKEYIDNSKAKSEIERSELNKEKTGVFLGAYAINPINNKKIPIYISDYVLASYGTGAVMAVPAHDERDYEFAKKFNLEIIKVVESEEPCFTKDGIHINSELINGLYNKEAQEKIIDFLEENKIGKKFINYKLRDWLFSRQRYWGEPFPIIHLENNTMVLDKNLPVVLPVIENIKHSTTGESPLANLDDWLEVEVNGIKGRRETNTMPQSAASSWYYIAYILQNSGRQLDLSDESTYDEINKWLPVDLYVGGTEHAVGHLLYARFWHKFLYDLGILKTNEPFLKLVNQGMILGPDGEKMSKRKGNVINPDDIISTHGADALRLYEMFMGPIEQAKPWSTTSLDGSRKFLDRVNRLFESNKFVDYNDGKLDKIYHETVKKITLDFEKIAFNTAISQMMIFINECYNAETIYKEYAKNFILMFSTIAPHLGEELYQTFDNVETLTYLKWPEYDESFLKQSNVNYVIQINGKLRGQHEFKIDEDSKIVEKTILELQSLNSYFDGKEIIKVVVVKNKLINVVVK